MKPDDFGCIQLPGIPAEVPGALISIALEAIDDGIAVGNDLVHIQLQVGDLAAGFDPDLGVVDKMGGVGIQGKGDVIDLPSPVGVT